MNFSFVCIIKVNIVALTLTVSSSSKRVDQRNFCGFGCRQYAAWNVEGFRAKSKMYYVIRQPDQRTTTCQACASNQWLLLVSTAQPTARPANENKESPRSILTIHPRHH
jgi:hypothetical protein